MKAGGMKESEGKLLDGGGTRKRPTGEGGARMGVKTNERRAASARGAAQTVGCLNAYKWGCRGAFKCF